MSKYIGYLIHDPQTGFLLEAENHAARVFESKAAADKAQEFALNSFRLVKVKVKYEAMCKSLLEGALYCFDEESFRRFQKAIRNDMAYKQYSARMTDRTHIRWKQST